jgi:prepilin-type N-terminal cleavage/methylation domain-containing protein
MKLSKVSNRQGFTLSELLIAVSIGAVALAATISASVGLQKSLNAIDDYFTVHSQQIRIVDYLSRDVKRSFIVTSTSSPQTVTCMIPNYVIQSGDSDYNGSNAGTRRTPTIIKTVNNGIIVDYGTRTVSDAVTISASAILTSASAAFTASDVGKSIAGTWIPPGATIQSYVGPTTVTMSSSATATATGVEVIIGASTVVYSINGQSILRTENGALTTIAASTDNLLPSWLDVDLSNTECLRTTITFLPIFTSGGATTERSGTTLYSTVYLRNKRRG